MRKLFEKYLWKFLRKADPAYHRSKTSWSQQGEDLLIDFIFANYLNCKTPSYLDIGANHPFHFSNTYYFYKKGCRGVNVEPDPNLIQLLKKSRPSDINVAAGVGVGQEDTELDFYMMSSSTLNTFSKNTALAYTTDRRLGNPRIVEVRKIKVKPINEILETYFKNKPHYFISIDVEGLDFEVVSAINFDIYRPDVVCIETNFTVRKNINDYVQLFHRNRYSHYGENSINSIFINDDTISFA